MAMTTAVKNSILNNLFRNQSYDFPNTVYIGLSKTTPNADGTGVTEPSGGAYARKSISTNSTNFSAANGGSIHNLTAITFPESTADWTDASNPIVSWVMYDAATGGNLLMYGSFSKRYFVYSGVVFTIPVGGFLTAIVEPRVAVALHDTGTIIEPVFTFEE